MRRAQAALEFLTTYGWAFMIILVMIGALSYFGIFNPSSVLPGRCLFSPEIQCTEFVIDGTTNIVQFTFKNNVGTGANFDRFQLTFIGSGTTNPSVLCPAGPASFSLGNGRAQQLACAAFPGGASDALRPGDKVKFEVNTTYTKDGGTLSVPIRGEIYGDVK